MKDIIAFQGAPGANSDLACRAVYPHMTTLPCKTFEAAFDALTSSNQAQLAMIPIENNQAGRVADIHTLLPHAGVYIIREHYQRVEHQLLAVPDTDLSQIREVRSHVMALAQCRNHIAELGLRPVVTVDTAGAAQELAQHPSPHVAVIASCLAADIYKLQILRGNIEDKAHNTTRFVVLSPKPIWATPDNLCMTSIIFHMKSLPAALYKCLGGFATNGVNITKLESYVFGSKFSVAQFYMDFEGHPNHENVNRALDEIRYFSNDVKILGVYPQADFRQQTKD